MASTWCCGRLREVVKGLMQSKRAGELPRAGRRAWGGGFRLIPGELNIPGKPLVRPPELEGLWMARLPFPTPRVPLGKKDSLCPSRVCPPPPLVPGGMAKRPHMG